MFLHRGLAGKIDVVGAVLGSILVLLGLSWGPLGCSWCSLGPFFAPLVVLLGALGAGQPTNQPTNQPRVDGTTGNGSTESGSVAGSGAQPLLDNNSNPATEPSGLE